MRYSHSFTPRTTGGAFIPNRFRKETTIKAETRIRRELRELVAGELKFTTKGKRGEGKTTPRILTTIRNARRHHTESMARQRAHLAETARVARLAA